MRCLAYHNVFWDKIVRVAGDNFPMRHVTGFKDWGELQGSSLRLLCCAYGLKPYGQETLPSTYQNVALVGWNHHVQFPT